MKKVVLPVVLWLSVLAHATLWWSRAEPPMVDDTVAVADCLPAALEHEIAAPPSPQLPVAAPEPPVWEKVATADLDQLATVLRAEGFPPHQVRAIVAAEVRRAHEDELRELAAQVPAYRYWDRKDLIFLPGLSRAHARLAEEMNAEIDALVGEDDQPDPFREAFDRRRYGDLPRDVIKRMKIIESDYQDISANIYQSSGNMLTPEDLKQLRYLEEEKSRDIAELLSPDQLLDYRLRTDNEAGMWRSRLGIMNVTEEEFRLIYQTNLAQQQQGAGINFAVWDPTAQQAQSQALRDALAGQLPPERVALLEQALDPQLAVMNSIVTRFELAPQVAKDAQTLQQTTIQSVMRLRNDASKSDAEKQVQLEAMREETLQKFRTLLGDDAFSAYEGMGGQWIKSFFSAGPRPGTPGGG